LQTCSGRNLSLNKNVTEQVANLLRQKNKNVTEQVANLLRQKNKNVTEQVANLLRQKVYIYKSQNEADLKNGVKFREYNKNNALYDCHFLFIFYNLIKTIP
jgi:hypothetical protein